MRSTSPVLKPSANSLGHVAQLCDIFRFGLDRWHGVLPEHLLVQDLLQSLVAGIAGGLALAILYASLSSGKMGLAAAVAGVLSAAIPAVATMFREGSPGAPRLIGFALATLGVWLISRSDDKTERRVLGMAILAGCGFAAYALAIRQAGPGSAMWIEVHSRAAALFVTAAITVYGRKLGDFRRSANLWGVAVGLVDVSGSVAFVRATQLGRLDTVVVLASLHPAVTVLLAMVLLKEKLTPWKAVGVCAALIAVPLIASWPTAIHKNVVHHVLPMTCGAVRALLCS
jgi:drug/metabolite transporter (DMT)-like permease